MLLDSSFYLMANAVRRQDSLVKDKEQEVKIFQKMILDKLHGDKEKQNISGEEVMDMLAHFIMLYREPLANEKFSTSDFDNRLKEKLFNIYQEAIENGSSQDSNSALIIQSYFAKHGFIQHPSQIDVAKKLAFINEIADTHMKSIAGEDDGEETIEEVNYAEALDLLPSVMYNLAKDKEVKVVRHKFKDPEQ